MIGGEGMKLILLGITILIILIIHKKGGKK